MAEKEEALAKRDEKRHREKEMTCGSFIDLTRRDLDIEESIARAKAVEAEATKLAEENQTMLEDLSIPAPERKAWF
jgi:hypothetical protein